MKSAQISVRAVLVGLVALPIIYEALDFLLHLAGDTPTSNPATWMLLTPISAVVLWFLPGLATGYIAKRSPLLHGLALGLTILVVAFAVLALLPLIGLSVFEFRLPLTAGFLAPIVIGSVIGAYIGNLLANRRRAP